MLGTKHLKIYGIEDNASGNLGANLSGAALTISLDTGDGAVLPETYSGAATSVGDSSTLNSTGIGASGVVIGDMIRNITDGSWSVIKTVSTNSITTLPLFGGSADIWANADEWAVHSFVLTAIQYNTTNDPTTGVNKREKILIDSRSTDTLTVNASGRGYDGSTAQSFVTNDNFYLFVKELEYKGLRDGMVDMLDRLVTIEGLYLSKDGTVALNNNTNFTARNNADSADIDLWKLTTGDILEFQTLPRLPSGRSISNDNDVIDKKYFDDNSSDTFSVIYGETIAVGDVLYFKTSDSKWYIADQSVTTKVRGRVIAIDAGILDDTAQVRKGGIATGLSGLTAGSMHYLSTSGGLSTTPGTTTSVPVGLALSATTILLTWGKKMAKGTGTSQSSTTSETITTGFRVEHLILMGRAVVLTGSTEEKGTIHYIGGVAAGGFVYEGSASIDSGRIGTDINHSGNSLSASTFTNEGFDIDSVYSSGIGTDQIRWVAIGE